MNRRPTTATSSSSPWSRFSTARSALTSRLNGAGAFGLRGEGLDVTDEVVRPVEDDYEFRAGAAYNLNADDVICHGGGAAGAHSDICHPGIAHAAWQGIAAGRA
jgi:hypothetical protein